MMRSSACTGAWWEADAMNRTPILLLLASLAIPAAALAQSRGAPFAATPTVQSTDGEGVYREVCQSCHMPQGQGAQGAAAYPALANNRNLEAAGYPLTLVVQGQRAMPGFGRMLTDEQVANVVTYIRTHFGNDYREPVTAEEAKALR
jgi:mono/diheme cytochrome c family protein